MVGVLMLVVDGMWKSGGILGSEVLLGGGEVYCCEGFSGLVGLRGREALKAYEGERPHGVG